MNKIATVVLALFALPLFAIECAQWESKRPELIAAAQAYVEANVSKKDRTTFLCDLEDRAKERNLMDVALDWFADNRHALKERLPKRVGEACLVFIALDKAGEVPPARVLAEATTEDLDETIKFLTKGAKK